MKKIIFTMLVLMLAFAGSAFAYPVATGDSVHLWHPTDNGSATGNYDVYLNNTGGSSPFAYSAFCLQMETYFNWSTNYQVSIDTDIQGYETDDSNSPGPTTLAAGTKYLFWNYSLGTLAGYEGTGTDVAALQNAIWKLQGYDVVVTDNEFYALVDGQSIDTSGMDVMVMNLWDSNIDGTYSGPHQSQLIAGAPVPEPATLILLGSGLAGLAFYRRKKR